MVQVSDLSVGKYYVTASNQKREVVDLSNDKVTYTSWSAKQEKPRNPDRTTVGTQKFCGDVEREVDANYRVGFGGN